MAVNHWNTDNPHTHIVVRGRDNTGKDLIIAGDYIAHGFRHRAAELATEWLGPRIELEIQQTLQRLGLADETQPGTWAIYADAEKTLRALGERSDDGRTVIGRVAEKGLADELHDRGYLVIVGVDGKAHYVALNARDELANYSTDAVVAVNGLADVRAADCNIAALTSDGLYRTDHHLAIAQGQAVPNRDPQEVVVAEGRWKVPDDLAERCRQYDAQRLGGVAVELKLHLPIERQARVIGATSAASERRLPRRTRAGREARPASDPGVQSADDPAQSGTGPGRKGHCRESRAGASPCR